MKGRIVRVFVVDQNENVPLGMCFIHKSEEMTTDLSDQELYFDIGRQDGQRGPSRASAHQDLNMVVVEIAKF